MAFRSLQLSAPLIRALADEGYSTPTPIQVKAIPPALLGRDLLGCAQTGTGKTAAFALPILHRLSAAASSPQRATTAPRALILAPTRELASQISESFRTYGRHAPLRSTVIFGGVSQVHQVAALKRGVDILVATPGRLLDLLQQKLVDLRSIEILVLDEADRMLDMGFIKPIRQIVAALGARRQTLLFSATMPTEIRQLANSLLHNPVEVAVTPVASTVPKIQQSVVFVPQQQKLALLQHLLNDDAFDRVVVFTRTKHGADKVAKRLIQCGVEADAIHGNKAQNRRIRALEGFRSGKIRVLVATDVAARGLDIDAISHVVNFDLPNEPEAYVHRIGRTGRAGAAGDAIAFCDAAERDQLRAIERLVGAKITVTPLPHLPPSTHSASDASHSDERRRPPSKPHSSSARAGKQSRSSSSHSPAAKQVSKHSSHASAPRGSGTPHRAGASQSATTNSSTAREPSARSAPSSALRSWNRPRGARPR